MPQNFKRHTLIRKIKDGGIGIIDPEIKIKATTAAWISISKLKQNKSNLSKFWNPSLANNEIKIDYILESNVTNIFDLNSLKGLSQFYK